MVMVEPDAQVVEARLLAGEIVCPLCAGELRPWGFARRRRLRDGDRPVPVRPRRSRCRGCLVTHVLLPVIALLRRRDLAVVIGRAVQAHFAEGVSQEAVAEQAGVHPDVARRWLRRFASNAAVLQAGFVALAHSLDPLLGPVAAQGSPGRDALEAIGVAAAAATRRLGPASSLWSFVAGATGGRLLANTNCTVAAPG